MMASRVECRPNQGQPDKDDELDGLAATLVQRVSRKAHIVECDLEPGRPENTEEADVSEEIVGVGDGVVCGESCEVGYEEEVEEELDRVGFVTLRKDEVLMVGAL
jgi:hypothetical protein